MSTDAGRAHGPGEGDGAAPQEQDVTARAELLPEEVAAGSDDPIAQAEAILEESEERTEEPEAEIRRTAEEATGGDLLP